MEIHQLRLSIARERDSLASKDGGMLLKVTNLQKSYPGPQGPVQVLSGLDLTLDQGETLALTGESGSDLVLKSLEGIQGFAGLEELYK